MQVLADWLLTPERVAIHLPSATAVVADLHLGYAEARRRAGEAVPEDHLGEQLDDLERVMGEHHVRRLVIAGDLLEDGRCQQARALFFDWLGATTIELLGVVPGNHDRGIEEAMSPRLPIHPDGIRLGVWQVVHGDGLIPMGQVVQGHEHPCLRWSARGRAVRARLFAARTASAEVEGSCYLVGPDRLVLPAYSREAAGVNVLSNGRWRRYRCCAIAEGQVLDLGEVATLRIRLSAASRRSSRGDEDRGLAERTSQ
jgi:metallophosphoesterase superfamily enzyme